MTATSRIQRTVADYRARLLANEAQAAQALDAAHQHALSLIQPALEKLYQQMTDVLASGDQLSPSWLYEANRLEILKKLITGQIDHYGALTQAMVARLQQDGVKMGVDAAMALLDASVPPGIDFSFGVPSQKAIADIVGATQAGSPLADLFSGFGAEAADKASKALITGVTLGWNPRQIAPEIEDALNISRARALTIARTEALRAYRNANLETFRANNDVVEQWIWQAALDMRTCAACIAMNGTKHSLDEEMGSHPNCRCVQSPLTKDWSDILGPLGIDTSGLEDARPDIPSGADWFDDQSESVQRAILGNAKYEAYQNGDFTLDDIVGRSSDEDWGDSIYEKPLKDLVK